MNFTPMCFFSLCLNLFPYIQIAMCDFLVLSDMHEKTITAHYVCGISLELKDCQCEMHVLISKFLKWVRIAKFTWSISPLELLTGL